MAVIELLTLSFILPVTAVAIPVPCVPIPPDSSYVVSSPSFAPPLPSRPLKWSLTWIRYARVDDAVGECLGTRLVQPQLSKPSNHCVDFGSFNGSTPGQEFQDPCKPNVTVDKIEVTVGPVGQVSTMIRSLRTTYSDGSVYLHGQPTNKSYTVDLATVQPRIDIVGSVVSYGDGIDQMTFLATDHSLAQLCAFGPIGGNGGDWSIQYGVVNAFYGNAGVGFISLGYVGCLQVPLN